MARIERIDNRAYRDLSQALRRKAKREDLPCWICGMPIDFDAHPSSGMAFTYDHIVPIARGGKLRGPGRPAHRGCNARRGTGDRPATGKPVGTRRW